MKQKIKEWAGSCQRCDRESDVHIMSMFDISLICMECFEEEQVHPRYEAARDAELRELKKGNTNFEGIGYPANDIANDPIDW